MLSRGRLAHLPLGGKIVFILVSIFVGVLLTAIFSVVALLLGGSSLDSLMNQGFNSVEQAKAMQLISSICMLGMPGVLSYHLLTEETEKRAFLIPMGFVAMSIAIIFLPISEWLGLLNQHLHLPEFLSGLEDWIYSSEKNAEQLVKQFLSMDSVGDLIFNLILIAFVPAICEEYLFRGALQSIFTNRYGAHVAIFMTAVIFSAFHMQFLGFLPRFALGVLLGYLYYWSGSLVYPILMHVTNNGFVVLLVYFMGNDLLEDSDQMITEGLPVASVLISAVVTGLALFSFQKLSEKA